MAEPTRQEMNAEIAKARGYRVRAREWVEKNVKAFNVSNMDDGSVWCESDGEGFAVNFFTDPAACFEAIESLWLFPDIRRNRFRLKWTVTIFHGDHKVDEEGIVLTEVLATALYHAVKGGGDARSN